MPGLTRADVPWEIRLPMATQRFIFWARLMIRVEITGRDPAAGLAEALKRRRLRCGHAVGVGCIIVWLVQVYGDRDGAGGEL